MTRSAVRIVLVLSVTAAVVLATTGIATAGVAATIRGRGTTWRPSSVTINSGSR